MLNKDENLTTTTVENSHSIDDSTLVPAGWTTPKVEDICEIASGQTPKGIDAFSENDGAVPWYRVSDMNREGNENYLYKAGVRLSNNSVNSLKLHVRPKGTIIFPKRGGAIATNKKRRTAQPSSYDLNTMGLIPEKSVAEYFWRWFQSVDLEELSTGSSVPQINHGDIAPLCVPLPPENEQTRIVTAIESLQQHSAKARTLLTEVEPLIDKLRQSILQSAFSGRLTADWRANNPDIEPADQLLARIRVERRQRWEEAELAKFEAKGKTPTEGWRDKYKEPIASPEEVLHELPDSWCWASIDELALVGTGSTPKRNNNEFWVNGTIPWITSTAVNQEFVTKESELVTVAGVKKTKLKMYPKGTLLIALYGEGKTRGMVTELNLDATINQALAAMQFHGTSIKIKSFAKHSMIAAYERMRQSSMGGVQPNLNLDKVRKIQVPLAPLEEQIYLLDRLDEQLEILYKLETKIKAIVVSLADLNSSVLAKAFRGELVPQDPNDEPASELLARIQAAREAEASSKKASKKKATRKKKKAAP